MVFGAILGFGIGIYAGITIGSLIFSSKDPKCFKQLDEAAEDIIGGRSVKQMKSEEVKNILELSPHWIKWPDYERVAWINRMISTLWPYYNAATKIMVTETIKPVLDETCQQIRMLECVNIEHIDLGKRPMKIGGFKTYETRDDEVIVEAPILWGSDCIIKVSATIRLGPILIYVPIIMKNVQMHAVARITFRPLVETLPCLGAIQISLINPPHLDIDLIFLNKIDLLAVPGIKGIAHRILESIISGMMLYPQKLSYDIMPNGGRPPVPTGMLRIKLNRAEGARRGDNIVKADVYCLLEVRENRPMRSKNVKGEEVIKFDEEFYLIVDNLETDYLKVTLMADDFGWADDIIGSTKIPINTFDCVDNPNKIFQEQFDLDKEEQESNMFALGKGSVKKLTTVLSQSSTSKKTLTPSPNVTKKSVGHVFVELTYTPFNNQEKEEEEESESSSDEENTRAEASNRDEARNALRQPEDSRRFGVQVNSLKDPSGRIKNTLKGLLTVTLTRCTHLAGKDTYVVFSLFDKVTNKVEEQKSTYALNDNNPRWGDKFDFVNINANSILTVTVVEKPGIMESMITMKFVKKSDDRPIGKIRISVKDVVRNGRIKDIWALQEVQQGEISLALVWTTVNYDS